MVNLKINKYKKINYFSHNIFCSMTINILFNNFAENKNAEILISSGINKKNTTVFISGCIFIK